MTFNPTLAPIYLLIALQALDVISTVLALRRPGTVEANPLLAPLFTRFGTLPTLLAVKATLCASLWYAQDQMHPVVVWVLCVGYAYIVINNFRLATK